VAPENVALLMVWHLRRVAPWPEVSPSVTSSVRTGAVTFILHCPNFIGPFKLL